MYRLRKRMSRWVRENLADRLDLDPDIKYIEYEQFHSVDWKY